MNIELIKILSWIPTFIIGVAVSQTGNTIFNSIKRRRLNKIENTSEFKKLFGEYDTEFKENFILPNLKEEYFYIKTGISTNEKSIDKYISLKNKLAKNYTWYHIKSAISYMDLNTEHITIKLENSDIRKANLVIGIFLSIILLLPSGLILNWFEYSKKGLALLMIWSITSTYLIYLIYSFARPILTAKSINKRLLQIEN